VQSMGIEMVALREWHIDPVTLYETWTDELYLLMIIRRGERIEEENRHRQE